MRSRIQRPEEKANEKEVAIISDRRGIVPESAPISRKAKAGAKDSKRMSQLP